MRVPSHRWLAGLLGTTALIHAVRPQTFDGLIPAALPGSPRWWTYASGAAELAVAVAVAHPRTRRRGELAAAVLFVAIFPGNVQMAVDASGAAERAVAYGRLPLQIPLVLWALALHRSAPDPSAVGSDAFRSVDAADTGRAAGAGPG